jgi:hypothetical protein
MMPMLNRSRANKKAGEICDGMLKDQLRSLCLTSSLVTSLKGSQKQKSTKVTLAIYNTISKVFINELTTLFPKCFLSPLDFPVSTSELGASTTLMRYKDLVQHKEQFQVQQQQLLLDNKQELQ